MGQLCFVPGRFKVCYKEMAVIGMKLSVLASVKLPPAFTNRCLIILYRKLLNIL